jgi:hypothetical protein
MVQHGLSLSSSIRFYPRHGFPIFDDWMKNAEIPAAVRIRQGRIAWFDAKARKVVGDVSSFDSQLQVMQEDLLFYTWMHERYGCDGKMQTNRTAAYLPLME